MTRRGPNRLYVDHHTAAHRLAVVIEEITARRLLDAYRQKSGPTLDADHFYDPHAATELGELIAQRMHPNGRLIKRTTQGNAGK